MIGRCKVVSHERKEQGIMDVTECINTSSSILMEGALGERLKREYHLETDEQVALASLVYSAAGKKALEHLWIEYFEIAKKYRLPFLATTPTRRVNKERMQGAANNEKLREAEIANNKKLQEAGFTETIVHDNVQVLLDIKNRCKANMYVGGMIGCRGDAYTGLGCLSEKESEEFHTWELDLFAKEDIDFIYAALIPTLPEAAGIAHAMEAHQIPYIISFTIQRDGCLIDGTRILDAISYIDQNTSWKPVGYMTNCVHPRILQEALEKEFNCNSLVQSRFLGIQANTSALSYAELDQSAKLRSSDPVELAKDMVKLRELAPLKIFGGCCGTNQFHMEEIAKRISFTC